MCDRVLRDETLHEDLCRSVTDLFWCFPDLDSAVGSVFESSLPTSTSVHLRLDDQFDISNPTRDLFRLIECGCNSAARRRNIILLQQFLGLILVNVHSQNARAEVELA